MIVLRITSGLGNQMFQYAFYTLLKERYKDTKVVCDTMWYHNNFEGRAYELENIFSGVEGSLFEIEKATLGQIINLSGKMPNLFDGKVGVVFDKVRRYINRIYKDTKLKKRKPYILEQSGDEGLGGDDFFNAVMNLDTSKDWYITGFFIEEKYYSQVMEQMKKRLIFPSLTEEWNIKYAESIKNSDSVSIHVRRGDYLSDIYKDKFLTLGRDYYETAVKYICERIKEKVESEGREADVRFFVFSDDADFVNREFGWLNNKTVIIGNTGPKNFRDMQLMSMCKYNITANSTFSQWGALLNDNPSHLTVYPKKYMVDSDNEMKMDESWVQI